MNTNFLQNNLHLLGYVIDYRGITKSDQGHNYDNIKATRTLKDPKI